MMTGAAIRILAVATVMTLIVVLTTPAHVRAQVEHIPVIVTLTGPASAVSGQAVSYQVHYLRTDGRPRGAAQFVFWVPRNTEYITSEILSGPEGTPRIEPEDGLARRVSWNLGGADEGVIEITVRVASAFVGELSPSIYTRGTIPFHPASTYEVNTRVYLPGTLPNTGQVMTQERGLIPVSLLLSLLGVAFLIGGYLLSRRWSREAQ